MYRRAFIQIVLSLCAAFRGELRTHQVYSICVQLLGTYQSCLLVRHTCICFFLLFKCLYFLSQRNKCLKSMRSVIGLYLTGSHIKHMHVRLQLKQNVTINMIGCIRLSIIRKVSVLFIMMWGSINTYSRSNWLRKTHPQSAAYIKSGFAFIRQLTWNLF